MAVRDPLTLTRSSRGWTVAAIVVMTSAVAVMIPWHGVDQDLGVLAVAITMFVMLGFPAVARAYVAELRRAGESMAADVLLAATLGAVLSLSLIWGIWALGSH